MAPKAGQAAAAASGTASTGAAGGRPQGRPGAARPQGGSLTLEDEYRQAVETMSGRVAHLSLALSDAWVLQGQLCQLAVGGSNSAK